MRLLLPSGELKKQKSHPFAAPFYFYFLRKNNRISFSGLVVVEEHLFDLIGIAFGEVVSGGGTAYYVDVDVSAKKVLIDIDASDVAK